MARKVILDVDPGTDDALALCLAIADPRLDVVAVTATGENISPEQATRNVQAIIEQLDPPHWPRLGLRCRVTACRPIAATFMVPMAWGMRSSTSRNSSIDIRLTK